MEEVKNEKEVNEVKKKGLSLDATMLLTVGAVALAVVVFRVVYLIATGR